ncbi:MAG: CHAT domain-containing protein, partial [Chitinophagales bacterium]
MAIAQELQDPSCLSRSYSSLGNVCNHTFKHYEALSYYHKALKIEKLSNLPIGIKHIIINYNIGSAFKFLNQMELAKNYFQKVLTMLEKNNFHHHSVIAYTNSNLGEVFLNKGEYEDAHLHYEKVLTFKQENGLADGMYITLLAQIGILYAKQKQWSKADSFFQESIQLQKSIYAEAHDWFFQSYRMYAELCIVDQKWEQAIRYLNQAKEANSHLTGMKHYRSAHIHVLFATIFEAQSKYALALDYIQKSLGDWEQSIKEQVTKEKTILLEIRCLEAEIYQGLFAKTQSVRYLEAAIQLFPTIESMIEEKRIAVFQEKDQLRFNKQMTDFYLMALDVQYELYHRKPNQHSLEDLFAITEKNKAHSLLATLKNREALELVNIPEKELEHLQALQSEIVYCQTQLKTLGKSSQEEKGSEHIERLSYLQVSYHELIQEIEQNHPEYFHLKHQASIIGIKEIQAQLESKNAIISYTLTKKTLYTFCITSKNIAVYRIGLSDDFYDCLEFLIDDGILGLNSKIYVKKAYELYQYLIAPIYLQLKQNHIESLIIIPDKALLEFPFEVLLSQKTDFKVSYRDMSYLLKDYTIHYHYSATLWSYQKARTKEFNQDSTSNFVGFAPVYDQEHFPLEAEKLPVEATRDINFRGGVYKALLYSEEEVVDIEANFRKKGWNADTFLRVEANLSNFKEVISNSPAKFVHIAAHSVADNEQEIEGILFSPSNTPTSTSNEMDGFSSTRQQGTETMADNILYAHEIYQLGLKSDLVFLSCCETGVGKIAEGEGVLSLNRGLIYSGVANIVFTLFKIY